MNSRGINLVPTTGNALLLAAAGEKVSLELFIYFYKNKKFINFCVNFLFL